MHRDRTQADADYLVMLAVLNFQTEFMKSHYHHARVHTHEQHIEVVLTRSSVIPAEEQLAQCPEGRRLLERVHRELFKTGESLLRDNLEHCLGIHIRDIVSRLDLKSHTVTIVIKLAEAVPSTPPTAQAPTSASSA